MADFWKSTYEWNSSDEQRVFAGSQKLFCLLSSFSRLLLNEKEIAQNSTLIQNITCITAFTDKKIKCDLYMFGVMFHLSVKFKLKGTPSLFLLLFTQEKKTLQTNKSKWDGF